MIHVYDPLSKIFIKLLEMNHYYTKIAIPAMDI